ncbi:MAG: bifunctional riboflavin kinase/FMN adenylyltransferase [Candidatus Hydrothermia bacterium]|jgi:riboflavin kinase/FMN adenylyltransferase|nr:riboflavin kinase [Candidatus Hydrothermia bacterium]
MLILDFFNSKIKEKTSVTIGSFDGFHLAHKFIINLTIQTSKLLNSKSLIFIFIEHLYKNSDLILTKEEKLEMLKNFDVDFVVLLDKRTFEITREEFLKILKENFNVNWIIVGYNHRFGYKRQGDTFFLNENIKNYEFGLTIVPPIKIENIEVSSTNIRKFIKEGKIEIANKLLGYNFFLEGVVEKGKGFGRQIGFPTANIKVKDEKIIPFEGVYLTKTYIENNEFFSASYVKDTIETYIFNFNENLYNKVIKVEFIRRISDVLRTESVEELKRKIENDINLAKSLISS